VIDVEMVVPEGWVLIPTGEGTQRLRVWTVEQIVRRFVPDHLPRDKAGPWRKELRKQLTGAVDEASAAGARCVLLPLAEYGGFRLPGSLLVTVLDDDPTVDPDVLLAGFAADAGEDGTVLEIAGGPAVRVQQVVDSRRVGRPYPTRKVAYYAAHPEVPGTWVLATFTVLTDGDLEDPAVLAVVAMFDAVVGTMQWAEHGGPVSADEVIAQLDALQPVGG